MAECGTLLHQIAPRQVLLCLRALVAGAGSRSLDELLALHDHAPSMGPARLSRLRFHAHLAFSVARPVLAARAHATGCPMATKEDLCLLLRLALTNSFLVSDERKGSFASGEEDAATTQEAFREGIGEALFTSASRLNHSCAPNTGVRHVGRSLEVRAALALPPGEEVVICYGPQAGYTTLESRRGALQRSHFFTCACSACEREAAVHATATGRGEDASAMRLRAQRHDEMARELCEGGDFTGAAQATSRALELLRRVFAPGSSQLAHEEAKLAELYFNIRPDARAAAALRKAAAAMAACYGEDHDEVRDLCRLSALCR